MNGDIYVLNGHHRLAHARKVKKSDTIQAQIIYEQEGAGVQYGWDQKSAYSQGALINIIEGNGSIHDFTTFFRNLIDNPTGKVRIEQVEKYMSNKYAKAGYNIATKAGEDLYALFLTRQERLRDNPGIAFTKEQNEAFGRFTPKITELIANAYEKGTGGQQAAIGYVQEQPRVVTPEALKIVIDGVKALATDKRKKAGTDTPAETQQMLKGFDADSPQMADAKKVGDWVAAKVKELRETIRAGGVVLSKPKAAKRAGVGATKTIEKTQANINAAKEELLIWDGDSWTKDPDLVKQVMEAVGVTPIGETVEIDVPDAVAEVLAPGEDVAYSKYDYYYLTYMEGDGWAIRRKDGTFLDVESVSLDEQDAKDQFDDLGPPDPPDYGPTLLEPDVDEATWRRARESASEGADIDYSTFGPLTPKSFPDTPPTDFTEEEVAGASDQMELWEGEESGELACVSTNMTKPG